MGVLPSQVPHFRRAVTTAARPGDSGNWRWLVLCGLLAGVGFLAKQLQVLLVVPALVLTYLVAGPPRWSTRMLHLLAFGAV